MTRRPAGKEQSREGEGAAVEVDIGDQGRQWPVMISTFPAKVTSPSHRHNTHTLAFVSAEVSFTGEAPCGSLRKVKDRCDKLAN